MKHSQTCSWMLLSSCAQLSQRYANKDTRILPHCSGAYQDITFLLKCKCNHTVTEAGDEDTSLLILRQRVMHMSKFLQVKVWHIQDKYCIEFPTNSPLRFMSTGTAIQRELMQPLKIPRISYIEWNEILYVKHDIIRHFTTFNRDGSVVGLQM